MYLSILVVMCIVLKCICFLISNFIHDEIFFPQVSFTTFQIKGEQHVIAPLDFQRCVAPLGGEVKVR